MTNEIIDLLQSDDLKRKINETKHRFTEIELLRIIYEYAPTLEKKLSMLERFAATASESVSALANAYAEYEKEKLRSLMKKEEGFVFELSIKESANSYTERYLCKSYEDALICIDRFYEEYASIDVKETDETRYSIAKRRVFSANSEFEEDKYYECTLGRGKTVLEVYECKCSTDCEEDVFCSECDKICHRRCDEIKFPCFADEYALIKFKDYKGREKFGVCLYLDDKWDHDFLSEFYVIHLDSHSIQNHDFDDTFSGHDHIDLPLATLASPDELEEGMRENYLAFVEHQKTKNK